MVIQKLIKNINGGEDYIDQLCRYLTDERAINIGGNGVNYFSQDAAARQMLAERRDFGKRDNNPALHLIISYDDTVKNVEEACDYTRKIASYFDDRYQTLFCTHAADRGCSSYHAHIAVNPCTFVDGKMLQDDFALAQNLKNHIEKITGQPVHQERDNKAE